MNIKKEDEIDLYEYWKILVKRRKILLGIFLVPVITTIIIALVTPHYYRGESEIKNPIIPAQNIVDLFENFDDAQKNTIFANNSGAIKSVLISLPKKSTDKVSVTIDAITADIIPQAFQDIFDYISNIPEIEKIYAEKKLKTERFIEETNFKIEKRIAAQNANNLFLNLITDRVKKKQFSFVNINPADLIIKDGELSLEIKNLEQEKSDAIKKKESNVKASVGILDLPSINKQPSYEKVKQRIIIAAAISFMAGIFAVFFLEYTERMRIGNNK